MANKSEEFDRLDRLLSRADVHIARVFRQMIDELRGALDLTRVADLIERGDLAALDQMFEDAAKQLGIATQAVFVEAGRDSSGYISEKLRATIAFDQTNAIAVQIMQEATLRMIRGFVDSQREVVRNVITNGIVDGIGPREQARNFREVVGLTARQAKTVTLYRAKLEQVGNTGVKTSIQRLALRLALRDGRGDAQIKRAIREGTPLPKERIDWLVERYRARAIKLRAETIARTEALAAVHQGHKQAFDQAILDGRLLPEEIEEEWVSAGDMRVRHSHTLLNGTKQAFGQLWQGLYGLLRFPGDPDADPRERINCRCILVRRILGRLRNTP